MKLVLHLFPILLPPNYYDYNSLKVNCQGFFHKK
nr:MAG TPA: hypothetical protein [Caudoviricetes sp.]